MTSQYANRKPVLTNVILYYNATVTGGPILYGPFERFQQLQRSPMSNAYNVLKHFVNVPDVSWKLISKLTWKYERHINVPEGQAILLGIRLWLRQRGYKRRV